MKALWDMADFVRRVRRELRFGELSRAPLQLLRLEFRGDTAACEWVARPQDAFDTDLDPGVSHRNQALQALRDAVAVRRLLFDALPDIRVAELRVYRHSAEPAELILAGTVTREDEAPLTVHPVAMQAKLCGLHFSLQDGALEAL